MSDPRPAGGAGPPSAGPAEPAGGAGTPQADPGAGPGRNLACQVGPVLGSTAPEAVPGDARRTAGRGPRGVRKASRRDARRAEIVAAAAQTFARQGYAAVGMRDVAEAVGIRGASLYHDFASKEEILYAVCLTVTEEPNTLNLPLLDAPGTPTNRLAALVRAHLEHLHRRRVEHLVGLHEMPALTPEHRAVIDDHRRYYQRRVRDCVIAGVAAGEFAVPDARLAAFAICDMLNGFSHWFQEDRDLALDDVIDGYVELVVGRLLGSPDFY